MMPVFLICGVPGSGKTWVCERVADKFEYIPQDSYYRDKNHAAIVVRTAVIASKPIITECPFAERLLRATLEKEGLTVLPFFIVEPPEVVKERYEAREKKEVPKNVLTRAASIKHRAEEWKAPHGSSTQILRVLKEMLL